MWLPLSPRCPRLLMPSRCPLAAPSPKGGSRLSEQHPLPHGGGSRPGGLPHRPGVRRGGEGAAFLPLPGVQLRQGHPRPALGIELVSLGSSPAVSAQPRAQGPQQGGLGRPPGSSTCCGSSAAHAGLPLSPPGREHLQRIPRGCLTAARTGAPRGSLGGHGPRVGHGILAEPTGVMPRPGWASCRGSGEHQIPPGTGAACSPGCLNGGPVEPPGQGAPVPSALGRAFSCERVLGQRTQRGAGAAQEGTESSPVRLQHDWTRRNPQ